jgi:hypothetical protein
MDKDPRVDRPAAVAGLGALSVRGVLENIDNGNCGPAGAFATAIS